MANLSKGWNRRGALGALAFGAWTGAGAATQPSVTLLRLRVPVEGEAAELAALSGELPLHLFLPSGAGPHPLAVLHHERRFFTGEFPHYPAMTDALLARGWAVAVPLRMGYGLLSGAGDREGVNCRRPTPGRVFMGTTAQTAAVLEGLSAHGAPIDRARVLHVGVGVGGFAALCAAHFSPQGVVGAINFGGGVGAYPERFPGEPCGVKETTRLVLSLGRAAARKDQPLPTLWLYAANDQHFALHHVDAWFRAYWQGGGRGTLHRLPAWGDDGNRLMAEGRVRWQPLLDDYLQDLPGPKRQG
jgi:dienelactone hydrolase